MQRGSAPGTEGGECEAGETFDDTVVGKSGWSSSIADSPNTTLLPEVRAMFWRASSCRICMAAGEARIYSCSSLARILVHPENHDDIRRQLNRLVSANHTHSIYYDDDSPCLMSLAASTSALAAMTLDSPIRFWVAADESDCWSSTEKLMSLRRIDSMATPHFSAVASIWMGQQKLNQAPGSVHNQVACESVGQAGRGIRGFWSRRGGRSSRSGGGTTYNLGNLLGETLAIGDDALKDLHGVSFVLCCKLRRRIRLTRPPTT
jgi:hypothetical protein